MNLIKAIALTLIFTFCGNLYSHDVARDIKPFDVDESGMMVKYGGQLINKRQSLFCTHWDILGEEISFIARNGKEVKRTVVTIYRYDQLRREPIVVEVENDFYFEGMFKCEYHSFLCMPGRAIRPGDSGKGWYAMIDGKMHLVGINSYISLSWRQEPVRAFSPEVGEIYEEYQKELKARHK